MAFVTLQTLPFSQTTWVVAERDHVTIEIGDGIWLAVHLIIRALFCLIAVNRLN